MKWCPPGRRKRGRPKLTWTDGIRGLMGEKGLMEEDWNGRGNWRKFAMEQATKARRGSRGMAVLFL
jgi:hypothetical protein